MHEAIVVGGGIVGAAIAYHLVRQGAKTLLIDRRDTGRATYAGAGILAPETSDNPVEAWFDFAVKAVAYYPDLIEQLQAAQAGETGYDQCGKLTLAVSEAELETFETAKQLIFARQKRRGLPGPDDLHLVSPDRAKALFPPLAEIHSAIYYRQAARVDGDLLTQAMLRAAERQGLVVQHASVERLVLTGHRATGIVAAGETHHAGVIAIAGGAWSPHFGHQIGLQFPVEPQRGQIIHLHLPGVDTANWPIIGSRNHYYLVCWPGGHIVVGATRETGSGFNPQTTAAGIYTVLEEALWVAPGLAAAEIKEIRVGLRPMTPDQLPLLGTAPGVDNLYLAAGHGATGLQLGPYSGKLIAALMLAQTIETDISAFDARRFL